MSERSSPASVRLNRFLKFGAKIIVTGVCLWYVSRKIDFGEAFRVLGHARWFYIFLALFLFTFSKIFSALRLNIYFRNIGVEISEWTNIKLYWLGMFYNLFLPGSITGDAYKVIRLSKASGIRYKKTSAAVILDRFSGLAGLAVILAIYGSFVLKNPLQDGTIILGSLLAVTGLYLVSKFFLSDFLPAFFPTLIWGLIVQATQVLCIYCILLAYVVEGSHNAYIFIFLVSSMVAVLPLTIGGLGAREIVFLWGSRYFGLHQETSVMISLLFYFITVFSSSWGLPYVYLDPLKDEHGPENPD